MKNHLENFYSYELPTLCKADYLGFQSVFYAVARNSVPHVRLLLEWGINVHSKTEKGVPLLAFAVMYHCMHLEDTTDMVALLLSFGADPECIPKSMWKEYMKQPEEPDEMTHESSWLKKRPECLSVIMKTFHLGQRYLFYIANRRLNMSGRRIQLAKNYHLSDVLATGFFIVGQEFACNALFNALLHHVSARHGKHVPLQDSFVCYHSDLLNHN